MHDKQLEQPLPSSPESERAVLGSILLDNSVLAEAQRLLLPEDFYSLAHRHVFTAMLLLDADSIEITTVLLAERLRAAETLDAVGGYSFIAELMHGLPHSRSIARYADLIREYSRKRWLLRFGQSVSFKAFDAEERASEIVAWADDRLFSSRERWESGVSKGARSGNEMLDVQAARYRQFHRNISDAIPTGFAELDNNLTGRGLSRKRLTLLAARPSVGKTALALDIAANAAGAGHHVLFFSLEMSAEMMLDRLVSVASRVPRWHIQAGIADHAYKRIASALPDVCDLPITFDDSSRRITDIRRTVRERARRAETRPGLVIVDYLQLVEAEGKHGTRNDAVGSVSRALKGIAMEFDVPILVLAQLNREVARQGREPELHDLRDSGEVEQDADAVLFLFGDKPEEGATYREVTLKCGKQRDGKLFREQMQFNGELVTYRSIIASMEFEAA